uniref:Neuropeptide-like protein 21 n=1 Tax=Ascaris suum TaxID=6253 RepID=A0A0E3STQ3_ASCSU|nr:neuropeptide-like protein precursor 21 [Ascaris suum]
MHTVNFALILLLVHYGIAQEPDVLEKRGGGRPFTLVDKRAGGRFFKIEDVDALEKRGGGRPFYTQTDEKRGGGRSFRLSSLGEKRMAAQKIAMPELDFYEGALAEIGNWPFIEKRAGARSFPVLEDLLEKRRIYDAFSRFP